jgi:hypothetical protein
MRHALQCKKKTQRRSEDASGIAGGDASEPASARPPPKPRNGTTPRLEGEPSKLARPPGGVNETEPAGVNKKPSRVEAPPVALGGAKANLEGGGRRPAAGLARGAKGVSSSLWGGPRCQKHAARCTCGTEEQGWVKRVACKDQPV